MTLEEAIKYEEEFADGHDRLKQIKAVTLEECERAKEHRQIAEWLKDYKRLLEQDTWTLCRDKGVTGTKRVTQKEETMKINPNYNTILSEALDADKKRVFPCPFCGQEASIFQIPENTPEEQAEHPKWIWKAPGWYVIGCSTEMCFGNINHMTMAFFTEDSARKAWNTRADQWM